jgi:hypothetical protein
LFDGPTIAELAAAMTSFQDKAEVGPKAITRDTDRDAQELLTRIDQLTDEQVESLLREALAETGDNE